MKFMFFHFIRSAHLLLFLSVSYSFLLWSIDRDRLVTVTRFAHSHCCW